MLKGALIFILLVMVGVVAYLTYFSFVNFYLPPKNLEVRYASEETVNFTGSVKQFYPNMRFKSPRISYYFGSECSQEKVDNMKKAFNLLENKTGILQFYEKNPGEIEVRCGEEYEKEGMLVAGEGGPVNIINETLFNVILDGQIILIYPESCSYNVELHELLHVLGFEHSEDSRSVMYNVSNCDQILTSDYIDEIDRIYSVESLPDLYFSDVSAVKRGMYLNLNFTVRNQGLETAENVKVDVERNNKTLDSFPLNSINIGEGKIFSVENLRISSAKQIRLIIKNGREIYDSNNFAELFLED